jgi:hypothetical protein
LRHEAGYAPPRGKTERRLAAAHAKGRHPDDDKDKEEGKGKEKAHAPAVKAAGGQCLGRRGVGGGPVRVEGGEIRSGRSRNEWHCRTIATRRCKPSAWSVLYVCGCVCNGV